MLYPKEDTVNNELLFACRTCSYNEKAANKCIFRNNLNASVGATAGVTQDVGSDPTVGSAFCLLCGDEIHLPCSFCGEEQSLLDMEMFHIHDKERGEEVDAHGHPSRGNEKEKFQAVHDGYGSADTSLYSTLQDHCADVMIVAGDLAA
jgi:DNA-directed RNA polymerase II subunit RPB9